MNDVIGNLEDVEPMMIDLMEQADSPWFDDVTTPQVETRDDIVRRSLSDAVAWLSQHYGDAPERWEWGRPHREDFIPLWQDVEYYPMPFSRDAVEGNAESTLILVSQ